MSTLMYRSCNSSCRTSRNRPCVRCVWTGSRTWSSCAATAPASCVGTEWASVPSAARPSNGASSSTELYIRTEHIRMTTTTPAADASPSSMSASIGSCLKSYLHYSALLIHWLCPDGSLLQKNGLWIDFYYFMEVSVSMSLCIFIHHYCLRPKICSLLYFNWCKTSYSVVVLLLDVKHEAALLRWASSEV